MGNGRDVDVAYMIDQSHNMKGKMEAMVQTVCTAQEIYAKAALVDHARLSVLQDECKLVEAEECFRSAFLAGCAANRQELEAIERAGGRSAFGASRERLYRADHPGTRCGKPGGNRELRLSISVLLDNFHSPPLRWS